MRVQAIGYDPARDPKVFPRRLWRVKGSLPDPNGQQVLVSRGVANLLKLRPGSRLVLQVRTHHGAINALDATVSGVVATTNAALDMRSIFVPQALTRRLINATDPTHISVRLHNRADAPKFAAELRKVLGPQADVVTWQQETRDLLRLQRIRRKSLNLVVFVLLALAGFGMANTILMAAHERVREIGTLRALGMTRGGVLTMFLLEGGVMGLLGSVLGAVWGGGVVAWWMVHPIDISNLLQKESGGGSLAFSAFIYTQWSLPTIITGLVFGVVVAVVASIYPARLASRMAPADAVRAD